LTRGTEIVAVDGEPVINGSADKLNAGMFPTNAGETHSFTIIDRGATAQHTVPMTSADVTSAPVQKVGLIPGTSVGYMLFNSHIATAEKALIDGVNQLKTAGASDLVLDMRYNGGGYVIIAAELAYM